MFEIEDDGITYENSIKLPVVNAAMYHDQAQGTFSLGFALEAHGLATQGWDQYVVTSENRKFKVSRWPTVLLDQSSGSPVAVRRCTSLRLGGLLDEPRLSEEGLERILAGERSPTDLAPRIEAKLRQYVLLPEDWQYKFISVWIVATYLYEPFPVFPFLLLMSKHPGCGKSTLLSVLERLCFNANRSFGMTAAGLRRITDFAPGTLLLDEFEAISKDRMSNTELNEALNSKFDADARVNILVPSKGGNWYPKAFKLFSPLVIAKLAQGGASDTILDRSIVIRMKRLEGEFEQEHPRYDTDWAGLRADCYLWSLREWKRVWETFKTDSEVRAGLNRKADIWRVILSVGKVLLNDEDFQVLLTQAHAPEPSLGDDDLPLEFEAIGEGLEAHRKNGSVKATDLRRDIGDKLAPHLRGIKAFIEALRHLEDSHGFYVHNNAKGGTANVIFWPKPSSST